MQKHLLQAGLLVSTVIFMFQIISDMLAIANNHLMHV